MNKGCGLQLDYDKCIHANFELLLTNTICTLLRV